ncbi:MAG TPA: hypothetical protein VHM25_26000, partial [Polyangiaceae bacterium]|nr:hypothetical protein [Polyangiaceae bacterium]
MSTHSGVISVPLQPEPEARVIFTKPIFSVVTGVPLMIGWSTAATLSSLLPAATEHASGANAVI